ncbi:MAG: hypothetical protein V7754_08870 [Halioglobus sp.]
MRKIVLIALLSLLAGCVTSIALQEQVPDVGYVPEGIIAIAVVDDRKRVKDGKPPTYVGKLWSSWMFISTDIDMHVDRIFTTEAGDKDRTLAEVLQNRIVIGLQRDGWGAIPMDRSARPDMSDIQNLLSDAGAKVLVTLVLNEWDFSQKKDYWGWGGLTYYFDTDVEVYVQAGGLGKLTHRRIAEREVIEPEADQSLQNELLKVYRNQLVQIFDDPEIRAAIELGGGH